MEVKSPPQLLCLSSEGNSHDLAQGSSWTEVFKQPSRQLGEGGVTDMLAKSILQGCENTILPYSENHTAYFLKLKHGACQSRQVLVCRWFRLSVLGVHYLEQITSIELLPK